MDERRPPSAEIALARCRGDPSLALAGEGIPSPRHGGRGQAKGVGNPAPFGPWIDLERIHNFEVQLGNYG